MKSTLLFICLFTLLSCNSLVKKVNGEKKPKIETKETLQRYISEINLDIDLNKNMFLKNQGAKEKIITSNIGSVHQNGDIIAYDIYFFDENWNLLQTNLLEGCLKDEIIIESFYDKTVMLNDNIEPKFNLLALKDSFIDEKGNDFFPFKKNQKSIAIVVWAKYKGKKWALETQHLIHSLKTSTTNYDIFYLNLDPNEFYSQF